MWMLGGGVAERNESFLLQSKGSLAVPLREGWRLTAMPDPESPLPVPETTGMDDEESVKEALSSGKKM